MLEKDLWIAPLEDEQIDNLENKWFYNDPIFNLCIQLSYLNSSNQESYGAVALQEIDKIPRIIGLGWNIYMGGETDFKRQGYANHAEFQAAAVAESLGYNLNDKSKDTTIYVAGRILKEDLLFFNAPGIPFTCLTCTKTLSKYFKNVSLSVPTPNNGWWHMTIEEAHNSALHFRYNNLRRENVIAYFAKASRLETSFKQKNVNQLITNLKQRSIMIDKKLERNVLNSYEQVHQFTSTQRRALMESLITPDYKTLRDGVQASLTY